MVEYEAENTKKRTVLINQFIFNKERFNAAMAKKTVTLTEEQFIDIITTMREGFTGFRPNNRVATALVMEANLGIRISDIVKLKLSDIVKDGNRYHLDIKEQKTGKVRTFTVPQNVYQYLKIYCMENEIGPDEIIFDVGVRDIQKQLKKVCDFCEYEGISTHSFRKFFATEIYKNNGHDIMLVKHLLQHSSASTTQRYIGISSKRVEEALEKHQKLL